MVTWDLYVIYRSFGLSLCPHVTQMYDVDGRDHNMVAHKIKPIRDCEHYSSEDQEKKIRRLRCRICEKSGSDYCEIYSTHPIQRTNDI